MPSPFPGMDPYLEHGLLHELYDRAGYDLSIDYTAQPVPPFDGEAGDWVAGRIATYGETE